MKRCRDCGATNGSTSCDVTGFACVMVDQVGYHGTQSVSEAGGSAQSEAQEKKSTDVA